MKMILQKHTSKFVAGLFNSLGITACVALTACGGENKVKQTENQVEKLKSVLLSKGLNDKDAQAIADWLNNKNYGSDYKLNAKDLQEIFKDDPNKLNEVAEKLGVILTESDDEPDDEKKKEINEWLDKLTSLEDAVFGQLDKSLKEKVAQKFIENKIDITKDSVIKEKLAGFINVVVEAKKASEITLKVEGKGKVTITNVADKTTIDFVFDKIQNLQDFVDALKGKEITNREVVLPFVFSENNVKIGGHESGFDYSTNVANFFKCFEDLIKIEGLNLNVSDLSLTYTGEKLSLNGVDLSSKEYFKGKEFWTLVKDYASFFGITEGSKFEIEKTGSKGSETVKINGFESSLEWSVVVKTEDEGFVDNSGWENIFKLKSKEPAQTEVTVEFEEGKCTCLEIEEYKSGVVLNSLDALKNLVGALKKYKIVKIGAEKKFSLAFEDTKVKVCDHTEGFAFTDGTNFKTLLQYVVDLKNLKAVDDKFNIEIAVDENDIKLNGGKISQEFMKKQDFWDVVKEHVKLFDLGSKIRVSKSGEESKKVKIGETELEVEVLKENNGDFAGDWGDIFNV